MFIRALMVFLLLSLVNTHSYSKPYTFCNKPIERIVIIPELPEKKGIDILDDFWQDMLINIKTYDEPVYRFILMSRRYPDALSLPAVEKLAEEYLFPASKEIPQDVKEIVEQVPAADPPPVMQVQEAVSETTLPDPFPEARPKKPVTVILYKTTGCAPCARMSDSLRQNYAGKYSEYVMMPGSVTRGGRLISKYPTLEIISGGKSLYVIEGYVDWLKVKYYIDKAAE